jgi:hypothetical protein
MNGVLPISSHSMERYIHELRCLKLDGTVMETYTILKFISAEDTMNRNQNVIGFKSGTACLRH